MINILILLSFFIQNSNQALPLCKTGTVCPPGGLWSEWDSSGNGYCPTSCGSCSKVLMTRTCASSSFGCNCTGPTTRQMPCNTQICAWPAQRTCCIPYIFMKINGTSQCGPLPPPEVSQACCKAGGYWSDWTGYSKSEDGTEWIRSRECLSTQGGCPCIGAATQSKGALCPCPPPEELLDPSNYENGTSHGLPGRQFNIDHSECTAWQWYNRSSTTAFGYNYCTTINGSSVSQVRLKLSDNSTKTVTLGICDASYVWAWTTTQFTCNLYSLFWNYEAENVEISGIGQIAFK